MRKSSLIFFIVICCLLTFNQCKKKGKYLGSITFSEQDLHIFPYYCGESFVLTDSLGDSINYYLKYPLQLDTLFQHDYDYSSAPDESEYHDYYLMQEARIILDTTNLSCIRLGFTNPFEPPIKKYIKFEMSVDFKYPQIHDFRGDCYFENGALYQWQDELSYYDTLTLVNRKFYNVYRLSSHGNLIYSSQITDTIKSLFYNVEHGIVGLTTSKGLTWRLKQ